MNRPFAALLAFLDALLVGALGLGILLVPLTILWLTQFELAVDFAAFWRVAANFWLLGNGVDLLVTIDPTLALRLALTGAGVPFTIGIAPLGIAALTLFLGWRSGRRLADSRHRLLGAATGIVTVGLMGWLVALSATTPVAQPSLLQAALFPALVYAVGMATTLFRTSLFAPAVPRTAADPLVDALGIIERSALELIGRIPARARAVTAVAFRGGALAAATVMGLAGIVVFVLVLTHYGEIISLYESLQSGLVGGIALTVGQLPIVPNVVVWAASWIVGPGFSLGTGSIVSPLGTQLGLIPALPLLGALPQGIPAVGYAVIVVPVIIGFAIGVVLKPRLVVDGRDPGPLSLIVAGLGIGIVGASILAVLSVWAGGAAGPGRLADIGAIPGDMWIWSFLELAPSSALGLVVGLTRRFFSRSSGGGETGRRGEQTPLEGETAPIDTHKL
ncbi:DUF6350 family protein [Agreia sp. COWG]|uniref:cell division protein PerM n=1 Tax=Agreia sp. COWG TaxID=2773266 RepID=UPI0019285C8E|nr:DUF6350 family protein [Agreia sp. COWG]CAD6004048.1 conserved membrane protein of unknown function [Agreia sp. COWG]